jgi:hypothetical protein
LVSTVETPKFNKRCFITIIIFTVAVEKTKESIVFI